MSAWRALLDHPGPILADGAMGTMLFEAGLQFGEPPEMWNIQHPHRVQMVHQAYLDAGARVILTNTFGGSRFRLSMHDLQGRVAEFNRAAVDIARHAVEASGVQALVAGDIGPSGRILEPVGELAYDEAVAGFAEQAQALTAGGVDLFWIETMSDLEEVRAAMEGVRRAAPEAPVITTMTFDTRGRTMMGVRPEEAVRALSEWGAAAIGGNCGNGPDEILEVIRKMRAAAPEVLLVAKANAGIPELIGGRAVYRAGPEAMAEYALAASQAGARVIGACCGSTPAHLRAMAKALAGPG
jgi:5-methyltetrahydrofolate--homocysteine methyltransferase